MEALLLTCNVNWTDMKNTIGGNLCDSLQSKKTSVMAQFLTDCHKTSDKLEMTQCKESAICLRSPFLGHPCHAFSRKVLEPTHLTQVQMHHKQESHRTVTKVSQCCNWSWYTCLPNCGSFFLTALFWMPGISISSVQIGPVLSKIESCIGMYYVLYFA